MPMPCWSLRYMRKRPGRFRTRCWSAVNVDCGSTMKPSEKPRNEKSADPIRENKMNAEKRKALEAAGWRLGDAADFLGLTQEERRLVELRLAVSRKVRELREKNGVTQQDLAGKLK